MTLLISDTFTDSLGRLSADEQKAAKTTAFDLQVNPTAPGLAFHKLDRSKDKCFWSVRVNADIRLIVHRTEGSLLLCYVGHHEDAYRWAERRRLEVHPRTGAAQIVELRETVQEIIVPQYVEESRPVPPKALLFRGCSDEELLAYGVPTEWIGDVRQATEDTLLDLADHLPAEATEALLNIAVGKKPLAPAAAASTGSDPFAHPDAQRRFRVMATAEELEQALSYPWDKWTVFLHPSQRDLAERDFGGPARVAGSAGTGKTIVALHRAVNLARKDPGARVLLTTFSEPLAAALRTRLRRLICAEPRLAERIDIASLPEIGQRLYTAAFGKPALASAGEVAAVMQRVAGEKAGPLGLRFLLGEWDSVVDAWQLRSWPEYRDFARLGRKSRLSEKQRAAAWSVFEAVQSSLSGSGLITSSELFTRLAGHIAALPRTPFDHAVVDESQDLSVAQLRFLGALGGGRPNGVFFAGDLGQRIFQQAFSWKVLGIDIRGRCKTLKINYRTSQQIRAQADRLLAAELSDVDGNTEERNGTVSVLNGPPPTIRRFKGAEQEIAAVATWLEGCVADRLAPHEVGLFVRSEGQLARAEAAARRASLPYRVLDQRVETLGGFAAVGTMHLAKGLEFRAVVVMACDDQVLPSAERIASAAEDSDLDEVFSTERHLLYVACTRARDRLLVTGTEPVSEFLDDLL
ncbi:MAG: 3'-5' exonuclease [Candidatus Sumerlaeia bacterium]|nr:3'-5' exonuclease [Candidatus Sumerlaeia bacterium]